MFEQNIFVRNILEIEANFNKWCVYTVVFTCHRIQIRKENL